MANWHKTGMLQRSRSPEDIRGFEHALWAAGPGDIPHTCMCTWVPAFLPTGVGEAEQFGTCISLGGYRANGYLLKFANNSCPVRGHRG